MKYNYIEYADPPIQIQHSELIHDDNVFGGQKVIVYFNNTVTGAKGQAELPTYRWLDKGTLSKQDVAFCNKALHWNVSGIFEYARVGGMSNA